MNNKIGKVYSHLGEMITELEEALLESKEKNRTLCGELADSELNTENQELREEVCRLEILNDRLRSHLTQVTAERDQLIHTATIPVMYTTPADDDIKPNWHFVEREGMPKTEGRQMYLVALYNKFIGTNICCDGHFVDGPKDKIIDKLVYAWAEMPSYPKEIM